MDNFLKISSETVFTIHITERVLYHPKRAYFTTALDMKQPAIHFHKFAVTTHVVAYSHSFKSLYEFLVYVWKVPGREEAPYSADMDEYRKRLKCTFYSS